MVKVKQMPHSEKYRCASDSIRQAHQYVLAFLQQRLGDKAVLELQTIWQEGMRSIPENKTSAEKYQLAYANYIWMAKSTYSYIRRQLGSEGIQQFERAEVEMLKRTTAGLTMFLLRFLRAIAPGSAFILVAKQTAYQLQWVTPFSVDELSGEKMVVTVPRCQMMDFTGTEDMCSVGCQSTYRIWFAEQLHLVMDTHRQGTGCTKILVPLR